MRLLIALLLLAASASPQVTVTQHPGEVAVAIDGRPATTFFYGPDVTKPYLFPLRTADGAVVTRGWPMNPRAGERHDHIHHRGVWFAHSNVNGIDFWNSDPSYHKPKMGHIVASHVVASGGKSEGTIQAQLAWNDPSGKTLLDESRTMTFRPGNPRVIDFDFTLTARQPVTFGDDKDGVFGIRLAPELEEALKDAPAGAVRSGAMTDANGCRQEAGCWGKRSNWIDVSGQIDGKTEGVAIFDDPANPRHPTYWHARGYGLLAANIFGVKAFERDPAQDGSLSLPPGGTLHFRYRVVLHSGAASEAEINRLYDNYAHAGSKAGLR